MDVHVLGILAEEFPRLYIYKNAFSFSNALPDDKYGKCKGDISMKAYYINFAYGKDAFVNLIITGIIEI